MKPIFVNGSEKRGFRAGTTLLPILRNVVTYYSWRKYRREREKKAFLPRNVGLCGCQSDHPPPPRMVQSWFIHKILAEHKRRGLHSSRPVTRYIPGGKTRAALPSWRPESYLSLIRTCFFPSWFIKTTWRPDMDSVSPTCRTESPVGTLFQKTPEEASSPASSLESNAKVWMALLIIHTQSRRRSVYKQVKQCLFKGFTD